MEKGRISSTIEWASQLVIHLSKIMRVSVCLKFRIILVQITHLKTMVGGTHVCSSHSSNVEKNFLVRIDSGNYLRPPKQYILSIYWWRWTRHKGRSQPWRRSPCNGVFISVLKNPSRVDCGKPVVLMGWLVSTPNARKTWGFRDVRPTWVLDKSKNRIETAPHPRRTPHGLVAFGIWIGLHETNKQTNNNVWIGTLHPWIPHCHQISSIWGITKTIPCA